MLGGRRGGGLVWCLNWFCGSIALLILDLLGQVTSAGRYEYSNPFFRIKVKNRFSHSDSPLSHKNPR